MPTEISIMNNYFPAENHPGIFSTPAWIAAWQNSWADHQSLQKVQALSTLQERQHFYKYSQKLAGFLSFTTLFPAGISTQVTPSLRSEYFMLAGLSADQFIEEAFASQWDQLWVPDVVVGSAEYGALVDAAERKKLKVIIRDRATSYAVRIQGNSFENYLKHIGSNTRLKLFNKRKKLHAIGHIEQRNLWPDLQCFIDILNRFHLQRWGKPCYQGRNLQQISNFLFNITEAGGIPDLSVIYCDGVPISAVLDVYYRQRIYNIQSGYLEKFQDGISLGTLHLGLQIEKAFSTDALYYDFMAGNGKNSNYKKSLATDTGDFASLMLVRNTLLKHLYSLNDRLNRIRQK